MLHFFKNKTKIKTEYYERGFNISKKITNKRWAKKHEKLKRDFDKILDEKDKKIECLSNHVSEIEQAMEKFTHLFSRAKYLSIRIEEENEIKLKQATAEYQNLQHLAGEMSLMQIAFEKKYPEMDKKLNKFKRDSLQ